MSRRQLDVRCSRGRRPSSMIIMGHPGLDPLHHRRHKIDGARFVDN